jgi:hypothetical protein
LDEANAAVRINFPDLKGGSILEIGRNRDASGQAANDYYVWIHDFIHSSMGTKFEHVNALELVSKVRECFDNERIHMQELERLLSGDGYYVDEPAMSDQGTPVEISTEDIPAIPYAQAPQEFEDLVSLLEWVVRVAPHTGPDAVPAELPVDDTKALWQTINLMRTSNIEIILPKRVSSLDERIGQSFKLTQAAQNTVRDIQKHLKGGSLKINEYGSAEDLQKILQSSDRDVHRIVVTESMLEDAVAGLLRANSDIFKGVRLYNMALPSYYGDKRMTKNEQSVVQARVLMTSILMRLYDKDKPFVRMTLESILRGRLPEGVDMSTYIDMIGKTDDELPTMDRIAFFLHKAVSMVETLGKQLRLLERFVWTAA